MPYKNPEKHRASVRRWNAQNPDVIRKAAAEWRERNREVLAERRRLKRAQEPEKVREKDRRDYEKYPVKTSARRAVRDALKRGVLQRMPCERCGAKKTQAHHHDYSKPLLVKWLCIKCHTQEHRK